MQISQPDRTWIPIGIKDPIRLSDFKNRYSDKVGIAQEDGWRTSKSDIASPSTSKKGGVVVVSERPELGQTPTHTHQPTILASMSKRPHTVLRSTR